MATRFWKDIVGNTDESTSQGPTSTGEGTFAGVVMQITDEDTFRIGDRAVRLCGVNSPERGESGYREAGAYLDRLIKEHPVSYRGVGSGSVCDGRSKGTSYNRVVATCFVNGQDIATKMVRGGHAIDWPRHSSGYYGR